MRTDNPAGEYYLTDMAEILPRAGHDVEAMQIDDPREALGINTRVELAEADRIMRERKRRELMLAGVTIESPETVMIDAGVRVGIDTVVEPFAQILGNTTIGENCRIGATPSSSIPSSATAWRSGRLPCGRLRGGARRRSGRSRACAWATTSKKARTSAISWS